MIPELGGDFLQRLRAFYYIVETGSITKAARAMRRSQSTVSQHLKLLEEELGGVLVQRTAKGAKLTLNGERLFALALEVFERVALIKSQSDELERRVSGIVSLSLSPVPLLSYLPVQLKGLRGAFPDVEFEINQSPGIDQMLKSLEMGAFDFCVATKSMVPKHLQYMHLYSSRLVLALPKSMRLSAASFKSMKDVAALPHIAPAGWASISKTVHESFNQQGLSYAPVHTANAFVLQIQMVDAGFGAAILDRTLVDYLLADSRNLPNVKVVDLGDMFPRRDFGIIVKKKRYLTNQAVKVIDYLLERAST